MERKTKKLAVCRIVLDVVMLLLTASMFTHRAVSLLYHEVAGLGVIALFVVHCILNGKTIKAMYTKREKTTPRLKFLKVLDIVNALAWLAVLVTSVLVSRKVFPFGMRGLQGWHKFVSAVAMLTTGVHFGMHWSLFRVKLEKSCAVCKVVAVLLLAVVLSYGSHSLYSSGYLRWFSAPFSSHQMRGEGRRGGRGSGQWGERRMRNGEGNPRANRQADGENAPWMQEELSIAPPVKEFENNTEAPAEEVLPEGKPEGAPEMPEGEIPFLAESEAEGEENAEEGEGRRGRRGRGEGRRGRRNRGDGEERWGEGFRGRGERTEGENTENVENAEEFRGEGRRGRRNRGDGEGRRGRGERGNRENGENGRGEGQGRRGAGRGQRGFSIARLLETLATGTSLMVLFAAVTHSVDHVLRTKKKVQGAAEAEPKEEATE